MANGGHAELFGLDARTRFAPTMHIGISWLTSMSCEQER